MSIGLPAPYDINAFSHMIRGGPKFQRFQFFLQALKLLEHALFVGFGESVAHSGVAILGAFCQTIND